LHRAPTSDQYCRAAEPLAVGRLLRTGGLRNCLHPGGWSRPLEGAGILLGLSTIPLAAQHPALRERILQNHLRFIPEVSGPFPTLVAIPGCSGIAFADPAEEATHPELREDNRLFRAHYPRQAELLLGEGFAVPLVHVHAGEDLVTAAVGRVRRPSWSATGTPIRSVSDRSSRGAKRGREPPEQRESIAGIDHCRK